MISSKITSKGQITIPRKIREFLDVDASDRIEFIPLENGKVLISSRRQSASALFGLLNHKRRSRPVTIEEMDTVIQNRRRKRNAK